MKKASYLADIQEAAAAKRRMLELGKIAVCAPAPRSETASRIHEIQGESDVGGAATRGQTQG
jgi:hypothetical protein